MGEALDWRDVSVPGVAIRDADADGLEIQVLSRTGAERGYEGAHFAMARVTTIVAGRAEHHEHVLLAIPELWALAELLRRALIEASSEFTAPLFDDAVTLRIVGGRGGRWIVQIQPKHRPAPDEQWDAFPEYSFALRLQRTDQHTIWTTSQTVSDV
jgi:hypothetical protein